MMKILGFCLVLVLSLKCISAEPDRAKEAENDVSVSPLVLGGRKWVLPKIRRPLRPTLPIPRRPIIPIPPKHEKCLTPIFKVKGCVAEIITAFASNQFDDVSDECCDAVLKVKPHCKVKGFEPYNDELISYCSDDNAPPPSSMMEFLL